MAKREKLQRHMFQVRLSERERRMLEVLARGEMQSMSDWVRHQIRTEYKVGSSPAREPVPSEEGGV